MLKLVRSACVELLGDAIAGAANNVDGIFSNAFVGLLTAWDGWNPDMTLANLDQANFDGYTRQALTFSDPYTGSDGRAASISDLATWAPTGNNTDNSIIGAFLADANTDGNLLGVELFSAPVQMNDVDKRLSYALELGIDPGWGFGDGTVIA